MCVVKPTSEDDDVYSPTHPDLLNYHKELAQTHLRFNSSKSLMKYRIIRLV
jgi:hypothetical protein